MRITLIGPTHPYRGGIAHYTTCLCRALRQDHEVLFISFSRQYPRVLFPGKTDQDTSQTPFTADPVEYLIDSLNPLTWRRAARRIRHFQPDLLIMPWWIAFWTPQFWTLVKLVKTGPSPRVVFICHNVFEHEANPLKTWSTKFILSTGDLIVTHSYQDTGYLNKLLLKAPKIVTAFHPSYAPMVREVPSREEARKILGLSSEHVLLFFGFVRQYKGLDVLIEAMPHVLQEKPVILLVVGEFWKDKKLYLERVDYLDIGRQVQIIDEYVPDESVGQYFSAADLVVQPYHTASGSGVSQLAYGFGRPVIATNVGNLPEVIKDGINGRIVPPGDAESLAKAIVESLEPDVLTEMTAQAAQTKERFSWERLAEMICG